jgi:hypothetical protein
VLLGALVLLQAVLVAPRCARFPAVRHPNEHPVFQGSAPGSARRAEALLRRTRLSHRSGPPDLRLVSHEEQHGGDEPDWEL